MSAIYSLNGKWDLIFDTNNIGIDQRWYANPPETELEAEVPSTWEKQFGKYPGSIAFYFRRFKIDESFNPKRTFMRFYGSSFHTTLWLNGKLVGTNQGSYNRFDLNVAKALKTDEENLICLRVATVAANRVEGTPISDLPVGTAYHDIPFGGIWNDIELVNGGKSCILEANVIADADSGKFDVEMKFSNPRNHSNKLLFLVTGPEGEISKFEKEIKLEKEDTTLKVPLQLKEWSKWSIEEPKLYKLQIALDKSYLVERTFAFRKFDIYRNEFYLNDAPIRLQGIVYGQTDPLDGVFNLDEKTLRKDLTHLKSLGFNAIRSGGAPLGNMALSICDELGLLVWQDLPIQMQRSSKEGLELSRDLIGELITQSKSHPSLVIWVLGSDNGTLMLENGTKLLKHVDSFDDSRPVLSNMNNLFVDSDGDLRNDTGKVMGVTNDKVLLYNSHRLGLPGFFNGEESTLFANYLQEGTDQAVTEGVGMPEGFKDAYSTVLGQTSNVKVLVQIDNPTLLPDLLSLPKKYTTAARNLNHGKKVNSLSKSWAQVSAELVSWGIWKDEVALRKEVNAVSLSQISNWIDTLMSSTQVTGYFLNRFRDQANHLVGLLDEFRVDKEGIEGLKRNTLKNRILISGFDRALSDKVDIAPRLRWLNVSRVGNVVFKVEILSGKKSIQKIEEKHETVGAVYSFGNVKLKNPGLGDYLLQISVTAGKETLDHIEVPFTVEKLDKVNKSEVQILDGLDTAAWAKALKAGIPLVLSKYKSVAGSQWKTLKDAVEKGAKVVFTQLRPDSVDILLKAGLLPAGTTAFSSSRDFHFYKNHRLFESFGKGGALGEKFEHMSPRVSLQGEFDEVMAYSLSVHEDHFDLGVDTASFHLGKGEVLVHQFLWIEALDSDPRAARLYGHLVKYLS